MKIYIVDGTPVLDGTPKELAKYQRMVQQLAVYDAYQKLLKAIAEGKPPGGQLEDKPSARKRATPKRKERMRTMDDSSQLPYVIAVDFDGILCQNTYPDIGDPNWDIIYEALKEQSKGAKLILWTCREGRSLEKAVAACAEWGLKFDAVNENLPEWRKAYGTDPRKVGANEYWDDRNVIIDNDPLVFRSTQCANDRAEWEVRRQCSERS